MCSQGLEEQILETKLEFLGLGIIHSTNAYGIFNNTDSGWLLGLCYGNQTTV